jgi:hypothetical protein
MHYVYRILYILQYCKMLMAIKLRVYIVTLVLFSLSTSSKSEPEQYYCMFTTIKFRVYIVTLVLFSLSTSSKPEQYYYNSIPIVLYILDTYTGILSDREYSTTTLLCTAV